MLLKGGMTDNPDKQETGQLIPFYACKYMTTENINILIVYDNDINRRIWEMYMSICKVLNEVPFPEYSECNNGWFDPNHAKAHIVGFNIVGPLVKAIYDDLKITDEIINIALLGDSTVSQCTVQFEDYKMHAEFDKKTELYENKYYNTVHNINNMNDNIEKLHKSVMQYLKKNEIINKINISYYCVGGSKLDKSPEGFLTQLACCIKDHNNYEEKNKYNAILMVGGWNNTEELNEEDTENLDIFKKLLENNIEEIKIWASPEKQENIKYSVANYKIYDTDDDIKLRYPLNIPL